ncbi:Gfo/Idh/MocA family oxidoreductase [Bacillaceae bacterium SIJ1]|uniref:Gfo/Idh/MocA family protein n=1 Tax=Litoribacterium kuwaitense TaxID=1398745 RepID=UPI0013EC5961|nr:Gfo/Idh/MocA family oxidoreductase [Litoribacterium kuwaitense]NGP46145.1 Gfo/Idh/MocA family oxidoreductase [Litoribacterium kuwaitense]
MSDTIKIGIIGSGGIAGAHVNAYKKMSDVEIVAVTDVIEGKAEEFIKQHDLQGAKAFTGHEALLEEELDGVSICTPNVAHHQTTIDALRAGKHVLVEKPMSVTLEQAIEMVEVERETGLILTIGFQPRYDPNMKELNRIVQSGELGHVYYVETGGGRRRGMPGGTFIRKDLAGAGALADIGCYSLDFALNALGYPKPVTVSAYGSNHFGTNPKYHPQADQFEVEDFGVALIRFETGQVLNFKISWAMHMDSLGAGLFLGTDAGLKVQPAGQGPWSGVWDGGIGSMTIYHDLLGHHTESAVPVINHGLDIFYEKVRDFAVAVKEGKEAPIPTKEIIRNQAIIDGILRSADQQREVDIVLPKDM